MPLNERKNADECPLSPFYTCPRWAKCSVNNCPLDPKYPGSYVDSQDLEKICTLPKSYRVRVAEQFPGILRHGGLTKREFASSKAWNVLPAEEKVKRKTRAKNFLFSRGFQKDPTPMIQTEGQNVVTSENKGKLDRVYKETGFSEHLEVRRCSI